jgi:hypothetical protein
LTSAVAKKKQELFLETSPGNSMQTNCICMRRNGQTAGAIDMYMHNKWAINMLIVLLFTCMQLTHISQWKQHKCLQMLSSVIFTGMQHASFV